MSNKCLYITPKEVMEIMGVKLTSAYKIIRQCNNLLKKQGKFYISGRCPRNLFYKMTGLDDNWADIPTKDDDEAP